MEDDHIVGHERALGELIGEVLVLCADAGPATVGVIAIDGTKVAANANRERTMDYEATRQDTAPARKAETTLALAAPSWRR